jgi:hypothetical protein
MSRGKARFPLALRKVGWGLHLRRRRMMTSMNVQKHPPLRVGDIEKQDGRDKNDSCLTELYQNRRRHGSLCDEGWFLVYSMGRDFTDRCSVYLRPDNASSVTWIRSILKEETRVEMRALLQIHFVDDSMGPIVQEWCA